MKSKRAAVCQRCGTCCEKGGPGLHEEDRHLVDSGRIPARHLFTIRKGEPAWDNVRGKLAPLPEEIIKIKGILGRRTCVFYENGLKGCGIYVDRPLECRVLNCRDTRAIEAVYEQSRLTRKALLVKIDGLWDLIAGHEERCSYKAVTRLVEQGFEQRAPKRETELLEIIRYDAHLRHLTKEKGQVDEQMLDFLFGRPVSITINLFGLALARQDGLQRLLQRF